jgi:hypothetical protein
VSTDINILILIKHYIECPDAELCTPSTFLNIRDVGVKVASTFLTNVRQTLDRVFVQCEHYIIRSF